MNMKSAYPLGYIRTYNFATSLEHPMCSRATCPICKKATWSGCGQHKEMVLAGIPKSERCKCTAADKAAYQANRKGLLARLFGR